VCADTSFVHLWRSSVRRPGLVAWAACWWVLLCVQVVADLVGGEQTIWARPTAFFVVDLVASVVTAASAWVMLTIADRHESPGIGLIGAFTLTLAVLSFIHGLTTPGVWWGPNDATNAALFWVLPLGSAVALPLAFPRSSWAISLTRRWRPFVTGHVALTTAVGLAIVVAPSLLPTPALASGAAVACALAVLSLCFALSLQQLRLSWISRTSQPFVISVVFALLGASSLIWMADGPYTFGYWLSHLMVIVATMLLIGSAVRAHRHHLSMYETLLPLGVHSPLAAFELGLDPVAHEIIATIESKDLVTRDHVARVAATAIEVGARLRLSAPELRTLALGALLHDIGKLTTPDEILNKPARLDPDEYVIMRQHVIAGDRMALNSPALRDIAPIVRSHHEQIDGRGYPDGLVGDEIPFLARIVSVCDAFDALSYTRQYRQGMGTDRAISILREHSGSQWDSRVVEALVATVRHGSANPHLLEGVGRGAHAGAATIDQLCSDTTVTVDAPTRPSRSRSIAGASSGGVSNGE
jgi:putative nucleotidyltransferase with HDIG domain